jgi:hypothetical protein
LSAPATFPPIVLPVAVFQMYTPSLPFPRAPVPFAVVPMELPETTLLDPSISMPFQQGHRITFLTVEL